MRLDVIKTYKSVHTWTGIIAGLLLYITFLAGALTMFKQPLNQWALQTETTLPALPLAIYDELIQKVLTNHPQAATKMMVHLPESYPQNAPVSWIIENEETHAVSQWHASLASDGSLLTHAVTVSAVGDFFDHLHRTAGIPGGDDDHDALGTYIMGVISALYFIALISGIIIFLPTWFKDSLSLRKGKNKKRYWLDVHNVLGITSLPFHIVIAITTFVFAFHDPIYGAMQQVIYGDKPMFSRAPMGKANREMSQIASINDIVSEIHKLQPDFEAAELLYQNLDTPRAQLRVGGFMHGEMVRGAEHNYVLSDPFSAETLYIPFLPSQTDGYGKAILSFFSLHFGNFGGLTVRWIYFGLGLAGALIFLSGNILWIESRRKRNKGKSVNAPQSRSYRHMSSLTVGVSVGTLIGFAASLVTAKWLPHAQVDISFWQKAAYYTGFLGSIAWGFIKPPMAAARQLLLVTLGLILLLLSANVFLHDRTAFDNPGINLTCLVIAAVLFAVYRNLKRQTRTSSATTGLEHSPS